MTEQQLLQFLQNYAAYSGADIRAVMDERFASSNTAITTQINALLGADADFSAVTANLLRITDAVPGSAEWNEGQNLYTAISENFLTLDPRITTAQQAADAAAAAAAAVLTSLNNLSSTVNALNADYQAFKSQTALDFSNVDSAWKAGDQAVLAVVEANRAAGVAATAQLRTQLDTEDQLLRDGTALVATNAAANLAQAKVDLRSEIAGEKAIAHNENDALAQMLTQDITAARADGASALALTKGNLEGQISEAEVRANATTAAAVATEAAARAQADTANTVAIAAVATTAAATNAILAAAMAGEASIKMELSRALRGLPSALGYTYVPPVFTTAWTVADVAASVNMLEAQEGSGGWNSLQVNLLGSGFDVASLTSITTGFLGGAPVTTSVAGFVGGLENGIPLWKAGAVAGDQAVGIIAVLSTSGTLGYVAMSNAGSPEPVTFTVTHQDGRTATATLTITQVPFSPN